MTIKQHLINHCGQSIGSSKGSSGGLGVGLAALGIALAAISGGGGSDEKFNQSEWGGRKLARLSHGSVTVYKNSDGEYAVVPKSRREAEVYYTDDAGDAANTAKVMSAGEKVGGPLNQKGSSKRVSDRDEVVLLAEQVTGAHFTGRGKVKKAAGALGWHQGYEDASSGRGRRTTTPRGLSPAEKVHYQKEYLAGYVSVDGDQTDRDRAHYIAKVESQLGLRYGEIRSVADAAAAEGYAIGKSQGIGGGPMIPGGNPLFDRNEQKIHQNSIEQGYKVGRRQAGDKSAKKDKYTIKWAEAKMLAMRNANKRFVNVYDDVGEFSTADIIETHHIDNLSNAEDVYNFIKRLSALPLGGHFSEDPGSLIKRVK